MERPDIIHLTGPNTELLQRRSVLLSKDFDKSFKKFVNGLYNDKESADIILTCHGENFYCHKILLQQYLYFRELIKKNQEKGDIIHHDLSHLVGSPKQLETLLQYSYLGILRSPEKGEEFPLLNASRALTFHDAARRIRSWLGTFLSPSDAIEILEYAFIKKHQYLYGVLVRRIGPYANLIFENDLHFSFSKENLRFLLEHGELWISELSLFKAVIRWCKNRVKLDQTELEQPSEESSETSGTTKPTTTEIKQSYEQYFKYFGDVIRYPLMGVRAFSEIVEPTGLIPEEVIYQTYRYFVTPEDLHEKFFGEKYFTKKLLRGFNIVRFRFKSDPTFTLVKFLDDKKEIGLTSSAARTVLGDQIITYPSVYYFEFLFAKSSVTSYAMFGVSKPENPTRTQYLGNNVDGYAIYSCNGNKYNSSRSVKYYKKFSAANNKTCRVGILLNLVSNPTKLYYYIDGKCIGKAFEGLTLPIVPAVSIANTNDVVRVVENPRIPQTWKHDLGNQV